MKCHARKGMKNIAIQWRWQITDSTDHTDQLCAARESSMGLPAVNGWPSFMGPGEVDPERETAGAAS
jgi:hypothetical protein